VLTAKTNTTIHPIEEGNIQQVAWLLGPCTVLQQKLRGLTGTLKIMANGAPVCMGQIQQTGIG
jgi:hypothetical protein